VTLVIFCVNNINYSQCYISFHHLLISNMVLTITKQCEPGYWQVAMNVACHFHILTEMRLIPPRLAKMLPPRFFMEHLLQGLNGVDAPVYYFCCRL